MVDNVGIERASNSRRAGWISLIFAIPIFIAAHYFFNDDVAIAAAFSFSVIYIAVYMQRSLLIYFQYRIVIVCVIITHLIAIIFNPIHLGGNTVFFLIPLAVADLAIIYGLVWIFVEKPYNIK